MQLFFVTTDDIKDNTIKITGNDVNHIVSVLRMKDGDELLISDESYFHKARITNFNKKEVICEIISSEEITTELPSKIYLFQALPKLDKMDFIIMKAVELGVHSIIPMQTKRCVVKPDEKKLGKKQERWQEISKSAAKQSKRGYIPQIEKVISFKEALAFAEDLDVVLFPYEEADNPAKSKEIFSNLKAGSSIGIFIGSEGGFDKDEVESARQVGAKVVTLGKRILRTETAGMTVLSILGYLLEG